MGHNSCQPIGAEIFNAENIRKCEKYVRSIQRKLDKAVANNDIDKIRWYTHILSKKSKAVKILAVHHATTNSGSTTAGIDGVKMEKGSTPAIKKKNTEIKDELLNTIDVRKKPSPIRRVFIPKSNGKTRPLGISTMMDRIIQDILRMALEPTTEYHANPNSYGFRPKRSCHDAIAHLFQKLSRKQSPQWIVEGDIRGCFDNISHNHICNTLLKWKIQKNIVEIIRRMLKSKIFYDNEYEEIENGTRQGSILSPMLANIALTTLDDYCQEEFGKKYSSGHLVNPIIRYADDFVITAKTEEEAEMIKVKVATLLRDKIGLELSDEKTHITNIHDGFNFLGFNIRKYRRTSSRSKYHHIGKLLIKPQKERIVKFLQKIQDILNKMKQATTDLLISKLNPILQGFAMYYRFVVSQEAFAYIDHQVWKKLWRWCKRRHPNKYGRWIFKRYFTLKKVKGILFSKETGKRLIKIAKIPIVRFKKIKSSMRVHAGDKKTIEYWKKRVFTNAFTQMYSVQVKKLFKRQKGICPCCENPITQEQTANSEVHRHHMLPRTEGGTDELNNLRLVHRSCHNKVHSLLSRKQMAHWYRKKLNYIGLKCLIDIKKRPEAYAVV